MPKPKGRSLPPDSRPSPKAVIPSCCCLTSITTRCSARASRRSITGCPTPSASPRKENGNYKFSFLHFVGVRDEEPPVGTTGTEEVAGVLVGFFTTSTPPRACWRR